MRSVSLILVALCGCAGPRIALSDRDSYSCDGVGMARAAYCAGDREAIFGILSRGIVCESSISWEGSCSLAASDLVEVAASAPSCASTASEAACLNMHAIRYNYRYQEVDEAYTAVAAGISAYCDCGVDLGALFNRRFCEAGGEGC